MDKIHECLNLLCDYGYIERKETLKETYESVIGIYNLDRTSPKMWEMVHNHQINALFQFEKQSGISGIELVKPNSVDDLATLNSVIRLMAQEKGGEMPLNKFARFKANIQQWYDEMDAWGLAKEEQELLKKQLSVSYGICESQEKFMMLVQTPECGGFDLMWADRLRKSIAKKNPKEFDQLTTEYFANAEVKGLSVNLCNYVWNVLVSASKGYGFNSSHCLAYSLIGLQEMNLAYRFPIIFWNCACLIIDSGGNDMEDEEEDLYIEEESSYYNEMEDFTEDDNEDDITNSYEEEDCDGYPAEVCEMTNGKKKKKIKTTNYGKISSAIGKMTMAGIKVSSPNINESTYTFSPDVENNTIRYGLRGITRIGNDLIHTIMENRPYSSIEDFLSKVKVNKPQMVNLIKAGAFDEMGLNRYEIMQTYIDSISDKKNTINLRNMQMLINFGLIPEAFDFQRRVFTYNKYLKKFKTEDDYFMFDEIALDFYEKYFSADKLVMDMDSPTGLKIKKTDWKKMYDKQMDIVRPYVKEKCEELKEKVNNKLFSDMWDKYCEGNISKWEMDSISCYIHPHELLNINHEEYGWEDFFSLSENPDIAKLINIKGKLIPIYNLHRIAGTVLDRDKSKKIITLLTTTGVVTVKIYGVFEAYDKRISEIDKNGKKHIIRESEFKRGNKIIITGIRQENNFIAKTYKSTPFHKIETIEKITTEGKVITFNRNDLEKKIIL